MRNPRQEQGQGGTGTDTSQRAKWVQKQREWRDRGKAQQLRDTTRPVLKLDFFRQGYADADNDDFCALRGPVLYDGACSELLDTGIAHAGGAIYQGTAMKCPEWAREPGRCRSAETARQCPRSCCLARKRLL